MRCSLPCTPSPCNQGCSHIPQPLPILCSFLDCRDNHHTHYSLPCTPSPCNQGCSHIPQPLPILYSLHDYLDKLHLHAPAGRLERPLRLQARPTPRCLHCSLPPHPSAMQ